MISACNSSNQNSKEAQEAENQDSEEQVIEESVEPEPNPIEIEQNSPMDYVNLANSEVFRSKEGGLFDEDEWSIRGSVYNGAKYCVLSEIVIRVNQYSQNSVLLKNDTYSINTFPTNAQSSHPFVIKIDRAADAETFSIDLIDALLVYGMP
ncbi:MAG: hypothetical protein J6Y72_08440 [Bacteroidales bacterium]|nr:hypothetical protein [Bacteroidales bacterium]